MDTLGSRLKKLRDDKELTLEYVANKIGTTKVSIGRYEKDLREPKGEMLNLLANFYDVSVDYLLGRTDISTPPSDETWNPVLTEKDHKNLDKMMEDFQEGLDGTVMLDGEILDEETKELFLQSVRNALEFAKLNNKVKYTPKKYRK